MTFLQPTDFETLNALAAHGDNKTAIRDIIHYTYFTDENQARNFAKSLFFRGFNDVAIGQPAAEEGDTGFVVRAHHDGTLIAADIGERLSTIRASAGEYSGSHEGWEAALILEE